MSVWIKRVGAVLLGVGLAYTLLVIINHLVLIENMLVVLYDILRRKCI